MLHSHMRQTTMAQDNCWLSCDHTFHTVANIGLFREEDGVWSKQYEGLFCVLSSNGEVLSWKATKSLSFDSVREMLQSLQKRLANQGKQVEEFIIDNCCSWRKKLQSSVFGGVIRYSLDIFHAVQRISTNMSKCHPFHSKCLQALSMVFRDPKDQGSPRTMETPAPTVLVDNL